MNISNSLIDKIGLPAFIVNKSEEITYLNYHAKFLFEKLFHNISIKKLSQLSYKPIFLSDNLTNPSFGEIKFNKLKVKTYVFKTRLNNKEDTFLYILDNILFNKDIINLLNHIGDIIDITNAEGSIELINDAVYNLIGFNEDDIQIGINLMDLYGSKITTEPAYASVLREQKPIIKRVKYKTGVTLLNRGYPVFSKDGDLEKVIIFGQNVSHIAALEEKVILSEEKNKMTLILDEVEHFFKENELVFSSDTIKKVINAAIKIAPTDSSVFIWGESGVGKEMITKIIHNTSTRKNRPFVDINCAAIPSELLESEFFGYEQGAFTGAKKFGKKGLFEEADGGTIFLDEISEMPYEMQSKLLRVIQEKRIRRVGSNKYIPIDVRYITATNLDIKDILNNNILRKDLYYRLSVIPIFVPPLRKRKEDIVMLINHFIELFNKQYNKSISLSNKSLKKLIDYKWPGNVRELRNVIQRLILLSEDNFIEDLNVGDYGFNDLQFNRHMKQTHDDSIVVNNIIPLKQAINILENTMINKVYAETSSIVKTAQILEINPSTIHRKIKDKKLILKP